MNRLRTRKLPAALAAGSLLTLVVGCGRGTPPGLLGSAVIEVRTYRVAGTAGGPLVAVYKEEGERVARNEIVAVVDTIPLTLRRGELTARASELQATIGAKQAEIESAEIEVAGLEREVERFEKLVAEGSAPSQKLDDLRTRHSSARSRVSAARGALKALDAKRSALDARRRQLDENISRCYLRAPAAGVVLTMYKERGEVLGPAAPVLELGSADTVYADFFVPQPLLATINRGTPVRIRVDSPDQGEEVFVPATVTWISDEAEFSPKNIQTRESRNELVFRVRARAANTDGLLKRGLPVELWRDES